MKRREFIALLGSGFSWPLAARAQQTERPRKIGLLIGLGEGDRESRHRITAFAQGLRELGWIDGQNMTLLKRYGDAKPERLPALAAELVGAKVDVIVTGAAQPIEAARKATNTIPIVMAAVGDAVGAGYVASLSRPGGNITGLTLIATDQSAKRLQLIKELSPTVARVAVLWNANASGHRLQVKEMEQAAPALGIAVQSLPVRSVDEIHARLGLAVEGNAQALVTMDDAVIQSQREHIAQLATRQRLPLMSEFRPDTATGGLISYGSDIDSMWRRAAVFVDKIFKGAKPGDLPVEQPTKFELIVSLKTAKSIEIDIPTSILLRADEVIE